MKFSLVIDADAEETVAVTAHAHSPLTDKLESLVMQYSGEDYVIGYTEDEQRRLPFADIECITVMDEKAYAIHRTGEKYRLKRRLYEIEALLPSCFVRINKSAIANSQHIEKFTATYSGGVNAVMKSGYTDYVSRRCYTTLKRSLK